MFLSRTFFSLSAQCPPMIACSRFRVLVRSLVRSGFTVVWYFGPYMIDTVESLHRPYMIPVGNWLEVPSHIWGGRRVRVLKSRNRHDVPLASTELAVRAMCHNLSRLTMILRSEVHKTFWGIYIRPRVYYIVVFTYTQTHIYLFGSPCRT
jgi:hypothetical protein